MINIDTVLQHYIIAALWSGCDDDGVPLDINYTKSDIHIDTLNQMRSDCIEFIHDAGTLLEESRLSSAQIGHDFWLTRNGHGSGFWDKGLGKIGDDLTDICIKYGTIDLYTANDWIYS